ncbi:MAG: MOSC domain-containing protein [Gemmatimonadota bacterium]|nr:MAG: MOSC domain-containing protein [Gemmatimonadota bacterium]
MDRPKVISVNISDTKGVRKTPIPEGQLEVGIGLVDDGHSGTDRQVSLLAMESIEKMRQKGLDVNPGDFAENITTEGIDLMAFPIGTKLSIGEHILLKITQKGKECPEPCAIYYQAGECVMPKEGIFADVITGGKIAPGDSIEVLE